MKTSIIVLVFVLPLVSCQSTGQRDILDKGHVIPVLPGNISGSVDSIRIDKGKLILNNHIDISFILEPDKTLGFLQKAESYDYIKIDKPDGPVATLFLNDHTLLAWIGDGIRRGMGPEGLSVEPGADPNSISIKSEARTWIIPVEKEITIEWNSDSWLVYACNISMGILADQPAFKADVVILRQ